MSLRAASTRLRSSLGARARALPHQDTRHRLAPTTSVSPHSFDSPSGAASAPAAGAAAAPAASGPSDPAAVGVSRAAGLGGSRLEGFAALCSSRILDVGSGYSKAAMDSASA